MALTQEEIDKLKQEQQNEQDNYQAARPDLSRSNDEQPAEKPKFDSASKYAGLFSDWEKKKAPEYNTRYEQQQKALMTAQGIGNALSLVGDVAGVAKGAPVARRTFKSTEPYLQAIEDKRMQYEKDTQAFEHQKYAEQLKLMGYMEQEEANTAKAEATAKQNEITNKRADASFGLELTKEERAKVGQDAGIKLGQDKLTEEQRQFNATQKAKKEELTSKNAADMLKIVQKDEQGKVRLLTDTNEQVAALDESEVNKAFALIQEDYGDSAELQKDIALLKAQFGGGLTKDARETLVTKHWKNSPKVKKFLKLGSPSDEDAIDDSNLPPFLRSNQSKPKEKGKSFWDKLVNMG